MRRTGRAAGWPWSWSPPTAGPAPSSGPGSFRNAIVALAVLGGSTNGVIHRPVLHADRGADLDFLVGRGGHEVTRESH